MLEEQGRDRTGASFFQSSPKFEWTATWQEKEKDCMKKSQHDDSAREKSVISVA